MQAAFLDELSEGALLALPFLFDFWAMDHQRAPQGDWKTWVILGGRGAGKTRAGAEWVRAEVEGARPLDPGRSKRVALVGETLEQVVTIMIEGESGILACSPPDRRPTWEATKKRLVWPNGAEARAYSAHDPERMRGPQFDAAWVDEYGCPAVDKGTNEPNRFFDPKSSESAVPRFSSGGRDDLIQQQYFRAMAEHWADGTANPLSPATGLPMVDFAHCYAWAWDARPYPRFPSDRELWNDGENYALGHWLTGRATARSLASVVAEICRGAGIADADVSRLYGIVRGYAPSEAMTAREALQPLMLAYGFDAVERDGALRFLMRDAARAIDVETEAIAVSDETTGDLDLSRASAEETAGRLRLGYLEADADFAVRFAEAAGPDANNRPVDASELPLLLTGPEARAIAERWVSEGRLARETVKFALPRSAVGIGAGDCIRLGDLGIFRIDAVEDIGERVVSAARVEPGVYRPSAAVDEPAQVLGWDAPLPVGTQFLDLPLLAGTEDPTAPRVAVFADPWRPAAVYASSAGESYDLERLVEASAIVGVTETELPSARHGSWDRGGALKVRLFGGALSSFTIDAVLAGANTAAIGSGDPDGFEVFQFANAVLVAPDTYEISMRLRGQAGTDTAIPEAWPIGARFVLVDPAVVQIGLPPQALGLTRSYRVGPASRPVSDPAYEQFSYAFRGAGLRPYAPGHLTARRLGEEIRITWIRRTRIDGDRWDVPDVALGESAERYLVRVLTGATVVSEREVATPEWTYTGDARAADGVTPPFTVSVAQISDRYGPGFFRRIEING